MPYLAIAVGSLALLLVLAFFLLPWRLWLYHARLRRLADALGLSYTQHSTANRYDRFTWEVSGEAGGRAVKLARVPEGILGGGGRFVYAYVLSVPCSAPPRLSLFIGSPSGHGGGPALSRPQAQLGELGLWVAGGEVDAEALAGLDVLGILSADGMRQAGLEVKEGKARLFYDLGSHARSTDAAFVGRARAALVEFVGTMEGGLAARE